MRIIRASQHKTVPWKNGGGTATAIVERPEGAGFESFDWRLSGAHVGRDGPFSLFPHVDRTMVILRGEALCLHGLPQGTVQLGKSSVPFGFPGDVAVSASLPDGPVDNLNVMTDRRRFRHSVTRLGPGGRTCLKAAGTLLVYAETGNVTVMADGKENTLANNDCVISDDDLDVAVAAGGLAILIVVAPV